MNKKLLLVAALAFTSIQLQAANWRSKIEGNDSDSATVGQLRTVEKDAYNSRCQCGEGSKAKVEGWKAYAPSLTTVGTVAASVFVVKFVDSLARRLK